MNLEIERLSPTQCANIISCFMDGGSWETNIRNHIPELSKTPT